MSNSKSTDMIYTIQYTKTCIKAYRKHQTITIRTDSFKFDFGLVSTEIRFINDRLVCCIAMT